MDSVWCACIFNETFYDTNSQMSARTHAHSMATTEKKKLFQIPWQNQTKHSAIESMENTFNAHFLLLYKIYVSYWIFAMSFTIFDVSYTRSGSCFGSGSGSFLIHCLNHLFEMHQVNFRAWTFCVDWLVCSVFHSFPCRTFLSNCVCNTTLSTFISIYFRRQMNNSERENVCMCGDGKMKIPTQKWKSHMWYDKLDWQANNSATPRDTERLREWERAKEWTVKNDERQHRTSGKYFGK